MISIAICDDEKIILDYFYKKVKSITDILRQDIDIQTFTDGNTMLIKDSKEKIAFDICFLDIDMPTISGFEIAEHIKRLNPNILVIFLTSMEELVYESFKYKPFRFLRKCKIDEELMEVLSSAILDLEKNITHMYTFKTNIGETKFNIRDIWYIECLNRKIYLKANNKQYCLIGLQFSRIVDEFLANGFVLIHRSCIVNLKYIFSISKFEVILDNGESLPISRYKVKDVKKAFTLYAK